MKNIDRRRQRRFDKEDAEAELRKIWREQERLWMAKRTKNWIELEKPERRGYVRFFVLRQDIAKSKEANFYNLLLKHIQEYVYCRDKKFLRKDYKTKKMVPIEQYLKPIEHKDWNKLNFSEKQKACFDKRWKQNKFGKGGKFVYEFIKDWMFVMKIEPYYITKKLILDPQLESRYKEIQNKIDNNNLWPKIYHQKGKKYGYSWKDKTKNDLIEKIMDKYIIEEIASKTFVP